MGKKNSASLDLDRYRVKPGSKFKLASIDSSDVQGLEKDDVKPVFLENLDRIDELQERLYAESKNAVLLVIQAMDAGGKDSTIRSVATGINPQGCQVVSFKVPSKLEMAHDFLWRVHDKAPRKGTITIFNRSHYEEVLVVRVHGYAPKDQIEGRYDHINNFERLLSDQGTRVVKVMLHISPEYQMSRFRNRLERPDKWWKFNPGDLKERKRWDDYMESFELALRRCSTDHAPWYVIPAEHKWFRVLAVSQILRNTLEEIDPQYPDPEFDPAEYRPEDLV